MAQQSHRRDLSGFKSYFSFQILAQTEQKCLHLIEFVEDSIDCLAVVTKIADKISLSLNQLGHCLLQSDAMWIRSGSSLFHALLPRFSKRRFHLNTTTKTTKMPLG